MSIIVGLKRRLDRLWQRHLALKELRQLDPVARAATARDIGISVARLERLASSGRHDTTPLTRLLAALGLSQSQLERAKPQVARDLEITCAECGSERRCERDLDAGRSPREFHKYCPNVVEIAALLKERGIETIPAERPKERRRPF
jgi:transcriptional regulator with XRE-family HTH domain